MQLWNGRGQAAEGRESRKFRAKRLEAKRAKSQANNHFGYEFEYNGFKSQVGEAKKDRILSLAPVASKGVVPMEDSLFRSKPRCKHDGDLLLLHTGRVKAFTTRLSPHPSGTKRPSGNYEATGDEVEEANI